MLLYGVSRFVIEFYRGDPRGMVGTLSTSQFVSILIVPLAVIMLLVARKRSRSGSRQCPSRTSGLIPWNTIHLPGGSCSSSPSTTACGSTTS